MKISELVRNVVTEYLDNLDDDVWEYVIEQTISYDAITEELGNQIDDVISDEIEDAVKYWVIENI